VKPKIFLTYMKAIGPVVSILIIVFYILNQSCSVSANFWLSDWSNDAENATVSVAQRDMRLGVYAALGLAQGTPAMWLVDFSFDSVGLCPLLRSVF